MIVIKITDDGEFTVHTQGKGDQIIDVTDQFECRALLVDDKSADGKLLAGHLIGQRVDAPKGEVIADEPMPRTCGREFFSTNGERHSPMVCGSNAMQGHVIQCEDCRG